MHKVPFARLALAFALLVCAFANVHAQGACEAPGEFDFTPQVCPNGQGWAHSRYGPNPGYVWSTYHWTVTGGTIISGANAETMYYTAGPGGTVEITLSVTGNGCSGTKTHTAVITGAQTADIHSNPTVCPYGRSGATVMYGDSQSTYQWSITNGTFVGSTSGSNVQFIASGSGAVGLDVVVSNPGGCNGTGHLDIPIVASPITIETFDSPTCPTEIGRAYAYGPWGGSHLWTAENATILGRVTGAEVRYVPDGTGPVTLTITSTTPDGCTATATRTMPVGTAAVPQLVASKPFVCPSSTVRVSVANAAEFTEYRWETQNASQTGSSPGSVTLQAGPGSTVTATVYAKTASGCERSESIAIPVGLPDGTISAPALVCPTTPFTASVPDAGPGYSYDWIMLDGGTIVAMNGREVTVQPDGGGSIRLRARVFSPTACDAVEAIVIDTAPEMTPGIRFDQPYCGGPSTASIDNAANYATVAWTIQDGVIDGPADGPTVSFHSTSGVAPTLTATVTSPSGCPTAPASAQAPIQTAAVPQLATTPSFCNTGQWLMAQVMNPEQFSSLVFSVANGTITAHNGNFIEISNTGAAPTVVTVDAVTLNGCAVTSSATIPYVAPAVPVITTTPAQHCGVSSTIEATLANASQFTGTGGIYWSVRNGYIVTNDGSSVTIQPTSASGVEITVEAFSSADCLGRASVVVPIGSSAGTPPPIEFESADVCPNGPGTAYVPMGYSSYSWSIENGVLNSSPNNSYVYFTANGSGPVQLSVALGNPDGCPIVSTGTLPLRETAPPVIQFEAADVCPAGPGIAWTDMTNWSAYSWSITNGIIDSNPNNSYVYYSANGNGPVTLTLQTWTVDGCTATTSASQPLRETTPPVIQFEAADVCPTGPGIAWTEMTNWDRYSWSITNGVLTSSPTNSYVYYTADGNGPVTLTLQTWTEENCTATTTASQPLRETTPPVIQFEAADVCPTGPGIAWTEMTHWDRYSWSITNGVLTSSPTNSYVYYTADGTGPVTLTLQTWTEENCTATTTASQPLRATTPPAIQFEDPEACANGTGTAWTDTANWDRYSWSIANGTLTSSPTNSYVYYTADGNGPVTLTLQTWTQENCTATATASQPLRTVDPPTILGGPQPDVCPGGTSSAYVPDTYDTYTWSIQHGVITSTSADQKSVMFTADGSGPVVVSVLVSKDSCTSSSSITVPLRTIDPPVLLGGPQPNVCPGGTSSAYVPDTYDTYTWSIQHGTITSTSADQKSVMFTADGSGPVVVSVLVSKDSCTSSSSITVPLRTIDPPVLLGGPQPNVCPGGTSSAYVPDDYDTYTWSIQNGTITSTSADQKSVMYTADGSGDVVVSVTVSKDSCTSTNSLVVPLRTVEPATITPSGPTTFCEGGSVTLTANEAASYLWSTGATTPSITVTASGSYSVTTTGSSGCPSTSEPVQVTVDPAVSATITAADALCEGSTGTATVPDAGAGASYAWSIANGTIVSGNGTSAISFSAAGSGPVQLGVTVTRGSCTASSSKTVAVNPRPVFSILASPYQSYELRDGEESMLRAEGEEGSTADATFDMCGVTQVQLRASVLNGSWSYVWSTGATGPFLVVSSSGTYTLTATNANGCVWTDTATVNLKPMPVATISGSGTFCPGGSTTLTAAGGSSYLWSTGATTPSITVSTAGTYSVQVTQDGCTATASKSVVQSAAAITADGPTTFCHGGSVTLTANPAQSYLWSNGATTQSITVTSSGTFTVQETFDGCTLTSDPVAVSVGPSAVSVSVDDTAACPGQTLHYTSMVTGGTNLTYEWLDGNGALLGNGPTLDLVPPDPGYYSVSLRVTDANGCQLTSEPRVIYRLTPVKPVITYSAPSTTFCESGNITLESSPASSYLWSTGETTRWITVAASGSYSVTTTDASGCTATSDPVQVTVLPRPPQPAIAASGPLTFCEGGSVTLTGPDGYAQYLWSTGETTQSITVSTSRWVALTVINEAGCDNTSEVQVTVLPRPVASIAASGPTTFCEGGSVTLTAPAGHTYLWSTGATTQSIAVGATGSYSVTITNANGCSASASTSVTVNPLPATPTITASGPLAFCEGGSVTLTAPESSSYAWSTGATTRSITVNASGAYSVTVTNANGCSASSAPATVTVNALPSTPNITASGATTFCEGGSVTLTAPDGYAYAWSTGATTQSITVNASGSYSVTITNANGCSASASTSVTVNPLPATPTITASGPTTFCEGGSVTLTAPAGYSYAWSNGATTQSITVNASGAYSVTITNANGCSASASTSVTVNPLPSTPTITASGPTTFCEGGSVTLTAPAGYSYAWSNGATTQSITVNASGSYSVTVTNANGCSATSAPTTVNANALPSTPTITANGPTTFCEGGSVTLTAPAGYSYAWSNGATTQSITVNASGAYSVTVTNASGCSATSAPTTVTVNAKPSTPAVTANGPTTFCEGGSVTLTAPAGYSYAWSHGATTQSITVNASGAYSVTVTNANGCSATSAPATVTVNPKPATPAVTASGSTALCPGASVTLTAPAGFTYLWSNGATTQSITVSTAGSYSVTVTNANGCSATSAPTTVTTYAATTITAQPQSITMPRNVTRVLSVTASGTALTYQWYQGFSGDTTQPLVGQTSSTYTVGPFPKKGTHRYWVRVSSATCPASTVNSATAVVTVN